MNNAGQRKVVLVLGMHRSGTSALMAGIHAVLDIPLAIETNHAGRDNPKGFFENSDVVRLNNRILAGCGASWETIGACLTLDRESSEYQTYRKEAMELLNARFGGCPVWGMKDPRFSVLLPFWEDVLGELGVRVYRVIALRHPLEAALSQQTRHHAFPDFHLAGKDLDYTLNLWYWYNDRLLSDLCDDRNWIVGFDDLLAEPDAMMRHLGQILDRPVLPDRLAEYGRQFLEKELKRHNINPAAMAMFQGRYGYVFTLYERLKAYAGGRQMILSDVPGVLKDMPDAQLLRSWVMPMYGYVDTLKSRLQEKREELAAAGLQTEQFRRQYDAVQVQIQSQAKAIAESRAIAAGTEQALAESRRIAAGMEQTIADCRRELSQVSALRDELRVQLAAVEGDLVTVRAVLAWQQAQNQKLKADLDRSTQAAAQAHRETAQKNQLNAELETAIQIKTQALEDAAGRIELAERDIEQYRDQVGRLIVNRDELQAQADGLGRQLHEALQEKEQALSHIQELGDELGRKEQAVAELNAEIESKTRALGDARHAMEQKMQDIARYRSELYDVYTSGSWRHTVWLRKIRRV
ncbi:MAG TPA: hypothetical protein PKB02_04825, partial [Anaerohalosphaeraceae bacterium]|nr:hypothetical protein [Anaerohalosphaeraceae bacterium]